MDKDQIIADLSEYLDSLIAEYEDGYGDVGQVIDELDKMIMKYRKGGDTNR